MVFLERGLILLERSERRMGGVEREQDKKNMMKVKWKYPSLNVSNDAAVHKTPQLPLRSGKEQGQSGNLLLQAVRKPHMFRTGIVSSLHLWKTWCHRCHHVAKESPNIPATCFTNSYTMHTMFALCFVLAVCLLLALAETKMHLWKFVLSLNPFQLSKSKPIWTTVVKKKR